MIFVTIFKFFPYSVLTSMLTIKKTGILSCRSFLTHFWAKIRHFLGIYLQNSAAPRPLGIFLSHLGTFACRSFLMSWFLN